MSGRSPIFVAAIVMVAVVAAACGSNNASREAAGAVVLPDCAEGLTAECIVSVPGGAEPIVVSNGAVVTFADQGQPVTSLATSRICWSEEDDVDASTCVTNEAELPAWVSVQRTVVDRAGAAWPSLVMRFFDIKDSAGEEFVPLPATVSVLVDGVSGQSPVNLEVACCDRVASAPAAAVGTSVAAYLTVANDLTLPDGTPTSVTWQVTDTENVFWDGSSRPDHAPPQGLQGLVQASGSGPYKVRTEVSTNGDAWTVDKAPHFVLGAVIEVGGERLAFAQTRLRFNREYKESWEILDERGMTYSCGSTPTLTTSTPQGELRYRMTMTCSGSLSSLVVERAPD